MLTKTSLAVVAIVTNLVLAGCSGNGNLAAPGVATLYTSDGNRITTTVAAERFNASSVAISGLTAGTSVIGMDVDPNGGVLAALGSDGQAYTLNPVSGSATPVGTPDTATSFSGKIVDIDFNPRAKAGTAMPPVQDVFRVVTNTGDNLRRNSATGARVGTDKAFVYVTGDRNAGKTVSIAAIAYTDSGLNGGTLPAQTTVYAIDTANEVLVVLGSKPANSMAGNVGNPDEGMLSTIGSLGIDLSGNVGFDIDSASGVAYVTAAGANGYNLYTIDLASGALSKVGLLSPTTAPVIAFAVQQR